VFSINVTFYFTVLIQEDITSPIGYIEIKVSKNLNSLMDSFVCFLKINSRTAYSPKYKYYCTIHHFHKL